MKNIKLLFVALSLIILVSCGFSIGGERTYKSEDIEYMERLIKLLAQRRIPYEYTDGMIRYQSSVKDEFEEADRAIKSTTPVQFVDLDVRTYFHNILDAEQIEYLELDHDGGTWTAWWPESEERKVKIFEQVIDYKISLSEKEASDCEDESSDTPSSRLLKL